MFDFFRKKAKAKAKENHEAELKKRLAQSLEKYDADNDKSKTQFTEIDFGEGRTKIKVKKINIKDTLCGFGKDPWAESNPGDAGRWTQEQSVYERAKTRKMK